MSEDFNPSELKRRDQDRIKGYRDLLDFYHGIHWEGRDRRGEKRLTFNYAKVFIDKVSSYLMSGLRFAAEPTEEDREAESGARQAEKALEMIAANNNLEQLDLETELDCAILGEACYKVIWDQESKNVRITAPDIQGIFAWRAGDDVSRVWRVASRYSLTSEVTESLYNFRPAGKTADIVEVWTAADFELWLDDKQIERKPNPYGFIPFVIYPNLREPKKFWGVSDLAQIMEPQKELNRATSQLSKILELSGSQRVYLEGITVARNIPAAEMTAGRYVAVVFFEEHHAAEAVVMAVYI